MEKFGKFRAPRATFALLLALLLCVSPAWAASRELVPVGRTVGLELRAGGGTLAYTRPLPEGMTSFRDLRT